MPDNGKSAKRQARTNLDFYHSPTQLRFDTWNRLEEYTSRLAEKHMRKADVRTLTRKTEEAMRLLDTFESYSAFPSDEDFRFLWHLFEEQDFDQLAHIVARVVRALTGGVYRSRHINLRRAAAAPGEGPGADPGLGARGDRGRPRDHAVVA